MKKRETQNTDTYICLLCMPFTLHNRENGGSHHNYILSSTKDFFLNHCWKERNRERQIHIERDRQTERETDSERESLRERNCVRKRKKMNRKTAKLTKEI